MPYKIANVSLSLFILLHCFHFRTIAVSDVKISILDIGHYILENVHVECSLMQDTGMIYNVVVSPYIGSRYMISFIQQPSIAR